MTRPLVIALTVLLAAAALSVARPARAQRPDAAGDDGDRRRRALLLLDESAALYDQGRFLDAADMLRRAHELFPEPSLLYNLGRALESAGDEEGALDAYGRYLEAEPASERRPQVEARIATLERELALERAAEQGGGAAQDGEPGAQQGQAGGEERGPSLLGPVLLMGAGGAVLASGIVLGALASGRQQDALAPGVSMEEGASIDDEAHGLATAANVALVVGGVAAAAGLIWLLLAGGDDGGRSDEGGVTVHLELGPTMGRLRGHF